VPSDALDISGLTVRYGGVLGVDRLDLRIGVHEGPPQPLREPRAERGLSRPHEAREDEVAA